MSLIKITILSFFLMLSSQSFGIIFYNQWNQSFGKELVLNCNEDEENLCLEVCDNEKICVVKEEVCHNCVANTAQMSDIFSNMGRTYVNTTESANILDLIDLIKEGQFVSVNSKSIYNMIYEFDSFELRQSFQSLCPESVQYPTVIFDKTVNGELGNVRYVGCGEKIYVMDHGSGINSRMNELLY